MGAAGVCSLKCSQPMVTDWKTAGRPRNDGEDDIPRKLVEGEEVVDVEESSHKSKEVMRRKTFKPVDDFEIRIGAMQEALAVEAREIVEVHQLGTGCHGMLGIGKRERESARNGNEKGKRNTTTKAGVLPRPPGSGSGRAHTLWNMRSTSVTTF